MAIDHNSRRPPGAFIRRSASRTRGSSDSRTPSGSTGARCSASCSSRLTAGPSDRPRTAVDRHRSRRQCPSSSPLAAGDGEDCCNSRFHSAAKRIRSSLPRSYLLAADRRASWRRCRRRKRFMPPRANSRPTAISSRRRAPARSLCCIAATSISRPNPPTPGALRCVPGLSGDFNLAGSRGRIGPAGGPGRLGVRSPQLPDLAIDRQPRLAIPFRPRHRRHAQRLRTHGPAAYASRAARLAGRRDASWRRLAQAAAPPDPHQQRLSPVLDIRSGGRAASTATISSSGA